MAAVSASQSQVIVFIYILLAVILCQSFDFVLRVWLNHSCLLSCIVSTAGLVRCGSCSSHGRTATTVHTSVIMGGKCCYSFSK